MHSTCTLGRAADWITPPPTLVSDTCPSAMQACALYRAHTRCPGSLCPPRRSCQARAVHHVPRLQRQTQKSQHHGVCVCPPVSSGKRGVWNWCTLLSGLRGREAFDTGAVCRAGWNKNLLQARRLLQTGVQWRL